MNHKLPNEVLLEILYISLDAINKSIGNKDVKGSLMDHTYEEDNVMIDQVTKTNNVWHTR